MAEHRNEKSRSRRAYLKDFKADESGKYSYRGKTLHSSRDLSSYQKEIRTALTVFAAVLAAQLAAGCIPGTGQYWPRSWQPAAFPEPVWRDTS